jgi:Ca-activated chloride channel family protein
MSFTWPLALAALALLPVLVAIYIDRDRRRVAAQASFGNPDLLPNVVDREPGRLRYLAPLILLTALVFMIVGVARPHATVSVPREEATIILAMDTSRSMKADDVEPTRLDAARVAAKTFLDEVPEKFRVGVVSFASRAVVGVAPTEDRALVATALDTLKPGEGTAIGDAIALSLQVGQPTATEARPEGTPEATPEATPEDTEAEAPPRAVLLISDGARDGGEVDPGEAATKAKEQGVPVYSVLVGTPEGVVEEELTGGYRRIIRVPPNAETLQQVATTSGGEYYAALDAEALGAVYEDLGSRLGSREEDREITDVFAAIAALLLIVAATTSAFLFKRVA